MYFLIEFSSFGSGLDKGMPVTFDVRLPIELKLLRLLMLPLRFSFSTLFALIAFIDGYSEVEGINTEFKLELATWLIIFLASDALKDVFGTKVSNIIKSRVSNFFE